jgi:biotin synthase-related radical SAM superfamily protein
MERRFKVGDVVQVEAEVFERMVKGTGVIVELRDEDDDYSEFYARVRVNGHSVPLFCRESELTHL